MSDAIQDEGKAFALVVFRKFHRYLIFLRIPGRNLLRGIATLHSHRMRPFECVEVKTEISHCRIASVHSSLRTDGLHAIEAHPSVVEPLLAASRLFGRNLRRSYQSCYCTKGSGPRHDEYQRLCQTHRDAHSWQFTLHSRLQQKDLAHEARLRPSGSVPPLQDDDDLHAKAVLESELVSRKVGQLSVACVMSMPDPSTERSNDRTLDSDDDV